MVVRTGVEPVSVVDATGRGGPSSAPRPFDAMRAAPTRRPEACLLTPSRLVPPLRLSPPTAVVTRSYPRNRVLYPDWTCVLVALTVSLRTVGSCPILCLHRGPIPSLEAPVLLSHARAQRLLSESPKHLRQERRRATHFGLRVPSAHDGVITVGVRRRLVGKGIIEFGQFSLPFRPCARSRARDENGQAPGAESGASPVGLRRLQYRHGPDTINPTTTLSRGRSSRPA